MRKYGITLEDKAGMLAAQGGACAICQTDTPTKRGWMVDHCHATGAVRGILCCPCNSALGFFKDSVESLMAAVDYLTKEGATA